MVRGILVPMDGPPMIIWVEFVKLPSSYTNPQYITDGIGRKYYYQRASKHGLVYREMTENSISEADVSKSL